MERTIIQWNVENWITIVLMVAVFYALLGAGVAFFKRNLPQGA